MSKSPVEVWLWLLLVMQPHNKKTSFILSGCNYDASRACEQIRDGKLLFLNDSEKRRAEEVRMGAVREVLDTCSKNSVRIITMDDEEYPELLRNIENPPIVLFCAGSLAGINERLSIAAVGARNVSDYGLAVTAKICGTLAQSGTVIVSGLAVGSDAAAHKAALDAGGRTVGVLGCGILTNYPSENAQLKRDIVENGGAVISELLPTAKASPNYFNTRNRIISGLSHGTLVLEAGESSGSLLTAAHAYEQGREVFCIPPHDILSPRYSGLVELMREGALPVLSYTDILDAFTLTEADNATAAGVVIEYAPPEIPEASDGSSKKKKKKPNKSQTVEESKTGELPDDAFPVENTETSAPDESRLASLEPNEAEVLKLLFERSADADYLLDKTDMEYGEISEALTNLELYGYITLTPEGVYIVI